MRLFQLYIYKMMLIVIVIVLISLFGYPQVTPTWVDIENGNILVNIAIGRIKHKNISRDPRVALAMADQNNPYDMVTIRGRAIEQITGDAAEEHIDKLAKKYIGKDKYPGR
jgi:hypothetical protein